MLKHIYHIIILIVIFVASLFYFSRDIKEVVFHIDNTTEMAEVSFPLVTFRVSEKEMNLVHGYGSNLDANKIWEGVTPLNSDQTFELLIDQKGYEIKKINYEVREFADNKLIESDTISVFQMESDYKVARVKIKSQLKKDTDYAVKITLVTSETKKMYFYQRVKAVDNSNVNEKLSFVMDFHNATMDKENGKWIVDRLETKRFQENTTLASVNIHSSYDLVTWGQLKPELLTRVIPTITEINTNFASVQLDYIIKANIAGAEELFRVKEFYRVQYTRSQAYLLEYNRNMEAIFDMNRSSVSKSQLKLGITSNTEIPYTLSSDEKKIAFVRNNELWYYNLENETLVKVFSFAQDDSDYIRDIYDQHEIRIIDMNAEGNITFMVMGYMNRGHYEGKVGVILYEYVNIDSRIEEKVFIPVDEPYSTLREKIGSLTYENAYNVFYFHIFDQIYAYNLITRQLSEIGTNVGEDQVVFLKSKGYLAWQVQADPKESTEIRILQMETGEVRSIFAPKGYRIQLMDIIDSNLVYGFVIEDDVTELIDGSTIVPMSKIEIASFEGTVLKTYHKEGYFVTNLRVKGNIIELDLVERVLIGGRSTFATAQKDYIMNQGKEEKKFIEVVERVTEEALTEYYVSLPAWFKMNQIPEIVRTVNTVIDEDPTLRLTVSSTEHGQYYAYNKGDLEGTYDNLAEAITSVRSSGGVVLDSKRRVVWEQGVKPATSSISLYENTSIPATSETLKGSLSLLLRAMGTTMDYSSINLVDYSVFHIIEENSKYKPVGITGAALDDLLYFIAKGKPVIAMIDQQNAILIYGYDTFNILIVDPKQGRTRKIGLQDSRDLFEKAGNVFISYLNQ